MIVPPHRSRKIFLHVSMLDFRADKFQLRGIDLPKKSSPAGAPARNFSKDFLLVAAGKPNANRRVQPGSRRNNSKSPGRIGSRSRVTTLR